MHMQINHFVTDRASRAAERAAAEHHQNNRSVTFLIIIHDDAAAAARSRAIKTINRRFDMRDLRDNKNVKRKRKKDIAYGLKKHA